MAGRALVHHVPWRRHDLRVPLGWRRVVAPLAPGALTWFPHWDTAWVGPWQGTPPGAAPRPVTTLHDLILVERGGVGARVVTAWMRRVMAASRWLVTVSRVSHDALVDRFPQLDGRLIIVPNGVSPACLAAGAAPPPATAHPPYLLAVATKRPHKRLEVAIRAFAQLAQEDPALRLVLVGERTTHVAVLQALARQLGVAHRVDDEVGLTDQALAARYAGAEAVLVCSQAEGFGMVPLEAMAAGAPVVAARHPATVEVAGAGAALVPQDDARAMAAVLRQWRQHPNQRAAMVQAGRAHAARYTWAHSASALAQCLLTGGAA
jgi:glycosyltransferase involved in cell wall biosynthesis